MFFNNIGFGIINTNFLKTLIPLGILYIRIFKFFYNMFFYIFSLLKQNNHTKIYNSDNFVDLELGLGLKENYSLSSKNYNFLPTIIIH